jgi:hypothetical protein
MISAARGGDANVFWDITLRDLGLLLAALALARLAAIYPPDPFRYGEDHVGAGRKSADAAAPARRTRAEEALIRSLAG